MDKHFEKALKNIVHLYRWSMVATAGLRFGRKDGALKKPRRSNPGGLDNGLLHLNLNPIHLPSPSHPSKIPNTSPTFDKSSNNQSGLWFSSSE